MHSFISFVLPLALALSLQPDIECTIKILVKHTFAMDLTKKLKVKMVSSVAETQASRLPAGLYIIYNADVPSSLPKIFWPLQSECIMHEKRSFLPSVLPYGNATTHLEVRIFPCSPCMFLQGALVG